MPSVSRTATSVKPSTQGWSRTNDVRFRKPALYSTELQGRMPSRRGDVATRLPIRRHSRHPFASRHGVAIATAFAYRDDGVYRAFHAAA